MRRGLGWAMLAAALVCTGCVGNDGDRSAAAVGAATRDYGTLVARTPRAELLTLDEIRPFLTLGFDIRKQPVLDPTNFNLTTVMSACGTPVATPFSPTKGFAVYRSTETITLEAVAAPGDPAAGAFVDALGRGATVSCAPFKEQLGSSTIEVTFARTFSIGELGLKRVAFEQRLSGGAIPSHRFVMAAAGGGRVTMLIVLSNDALLPENLEPVVRMAVTGA